MSPVEPVSELDLSVHRRKDEPLAVGMVVELEALHPLLHYNYGFAPSLLYKPQSLPTSVPGLGHNQPLDEFRTPSPVVLSTEGSYIIFGDPLAVLPPPISQGRSSPAQEDEVNTNNVDFPAPVHYTGMGHVHLLATECLDAGKLEDLAKVEARSYKKGKFSDAEELDLGNAIEAYRIQKQLSEGQIQDIISAGKPNENPFWTEISTAIPHRPLTAVYHYVQRKYPGEKKSKWTAYEDTALEKAVTDFGENWEKIATVVKRGHSDCRLRYHKHIVNRGVRVNGRWTKEEEEELARIVTEMMVQQGKGPEGDGFWGRVSELMGGRRGKRQCKDKWIDSLGKIVENEGQEPQWSPWDAFILVQKVNSLNVQKDSDIKWNALPDPKWNLWNGQSLRRRWSAMKRSIRGFRDMSHQEIVEILRVTKTRPSDMPM